MGVFGSALRGVAATVEIAAASLRPWLALAVRLWLAQAFLVALVHDMMLGTGLRAPLGAGWWWDALHRVSVSGFGGALQAVCPVLLALGLLTRPAAAALLTEAVLLASSGIGFDVRLFWTALLAWLFVVGAGPLSLDRLLSRGAQSSAVPGSRFGGRAAAWITGRVAPVYLLGLRLGLATAVANSALAVFAVTAPMQAGLAPWLPHTPSMVAQLPIGAALALALLLVTGFLTRGAAVVLLLLVPVSQIAGTADLRLYWTLLLTVVVLQGGGPWAVDHLVGSWLRRRRDPVDDAAAPHVVVVGGGFGGIAAVRGLAGTRCRVTLIDQRNHHIFQPLLYQVATAELSPADIATPVRAMVRLQPNARVLLGQVTGLDVDAKEVLLARGRIAYDHLVLATGARHSYFGRDAWAAFAPGLKTIEDATSIRRRLLLAFEEAEDTDDADERRAWLTFVIVGGGPTGVELAGAIAELAHHGMEQEFRRIDPAGARVLLIQSGARLLPAFPEPLSREAERALQRLGVEVQLDSRVELVEAAGVTVSGRSVPARTVLWAAGVLASPAANWLGVAPDRAGRLPVGPDLSVAGHPNVFAVGDTALSMSWNGQAAPGLAPAAKQGGAYAAKVIRARIAGRAPPAPFRYKHLGSLATIGRQSAVADFGFVRFRGALAWWLWGAAHIAFLVDGRSRVLVLTQWMWAYLTFRRGTRLITDAR